MYRMLLTLPQSQGYCLVLTWLTKGQNNADFGAHLGLRNKEAQNILQICSIV
jgi:hypothetical protein